MDSFGALKCLQNACEKLRRAKFADAVLPIEQLIEFLLNYAPGRDFSKPPAKLVDSVLKAFGLTSDGSTNSTRKELKA